MKYLKRFWKYITGRIDLKENMTPEECQALDDLWSDHALMKKALNDCIGAYESFTKRMKQKPNAREQGMHSGLRAAAIVSARTLDNLKEK